MHRMSDYEIEAFKEKCKTNGVPLDRFCDNRLKSDSSEPGSTAIPDSNYVS